MFRKFACILSAVGILLLIRILAAAAAFPEIEDERCPGAGTDISLAYVSARPEVSGMFLPAVPAEEGEPPRTGDYPAPIFTAMLISLGIVVVLVMTENRRK